MSDTPRTDAVGLPKVYDGDAVLALCRTLERENAQFRELLIKAEELLKKEAHAINPIAIQMRRDALISTSYRIHIALNNTPKSNVPHS
jgi:hypothetical protein